MIRPVKMDKAVIHIDSDKGRFEWIIDAGTAKEVGEGFAAIAKYLKLANHSKHGLNNISLAFS